MSDNDKKAPPPLTMPANEPELIGHAPKAADVTPPPLVGFAASTPADDAATAPPEDDDAAIAAAVALLHAELNEVATEVFGTAGALSSAIDDLDTLASSLR